jgi:hypothetical protein
LPRLQGHHAGNAISSSYSDFCLTVQRLRSQLQYPIQPQHEHPTNARDG